MGIPPITSIEKALSIYYEFSEIGTLEMVQLFKHHSKSTISRLKTLAKEQMLKDEVCAHGMFKVNTVSAFRAWGLDAVDLEYRRKRLQELGLYSI